MIHAEFAFYWELPAEDGGTTPFYNVTGIPGYIETGAHTIALQSLIEKGIPVPETPSLDVWKERKKR